MQYFFTDKLELMIHHGDAFTWTVPLISKSMKEMCLNLFDFTADRLGQKEPEIDEFEEDEQFKQILKYVDNELNFTGKLFESFEI